MVVWRRECERAKCSCRQAELPCTDLCGCCDIGESYDNAEQLNPVNSVNEEENEELEDDEEDDEMFILTRPVC